MSDEIAKKGSPAAASSDLVAWEVEIRSMVCIVFAHTKAKARMLATKSYWDAYGRRRGEWPGAKARRAERHDKCALRFRTDVRTWSEDYVIGYRRAQQPSAENLNAMETKPTQENSEACAGLAAATGSDLDPYQSQEYQRFVAESAKFCHCAEQHKPCDGVLAGGICDMRLDTERWSFCDE